MKAVVVSAAVVILAVAVYYYCWWSDGFSMLVKTPAELNPQYDYIIVGAGTSGSVLAARLTEDEKVNVLVLEAGGKEYDLPYAHIPGFVPFLQRTGMDWQYNTVERKDSLKGLRNHTGLWPRGKTIGGTSTLNFMLHVWGQKSDYDNWGGEWTFDKVLPYFQKLENTVFDASDVRGKNGPVECTKSPLHTISKTFLLSAVEEGFDQCDDYNDPKQTGFSRVQYSITANGRRVSSASAYLRPAMRQRADRLHVVTHAHVTKVSFNEENKAVGVDYMHMGKRHRVLTNREVILSAGTINSPHILMLSGIGPRKQLESLGIEVLVDSPAVGENLKDHLACPISFLTSDSSAVPDVSFLGIAKAVLEYALKGTGLLSYTGVEILGLVDSKVSGSRPSDLQLMFAPSDPTLHDRLAYVANLDQQHFESLWHGEAGKLPLTVILVLMHPKSSGSVTLTSSEPTAPPKIDPMYLSEEQDGQVLTAGVRIARRIFQSRVMAAHNVSSPDVDGVTKGCEKFASKADRRRHDDSEAYWRCFTRHRCINSYHPIGTCRIGVHLDHNAVVDARLRVHGVKGLRVVDASVFPDSLSANINVPAIMLAERAADLIKEDNEQR